MGLLGKWYVLEHKDGGAEVWDTGPFGPWRKLAGPFLTRGAAIAALKRKAGS